MLFGAIYLRKRYSLGEYLRVLLISAGIAIFNIYRPVTKASTVENTTFGYILLASSLACDGIYGPVLDGVNQKYDVSQYKLMYGLNAWSVIYSFLMLIVTGQLFPSYEFVTQNPDILKTMCLLALTSALGQNFIFFTMANFNSLVTSIITTTRKFFTVLCSVIIYKHQLNNMQWFGVALVFASIGYELIMKYKKNNKPLITKKD